MDSNLQSFVREALGRGLSRAAIREQLSAAGWRASEADAALAAYAESDFPVPVPKRRPYLPARVAFLHLVLFATLYTSAYNVGALLFLLLERWLPDAARPGGEIGAVRGSVAGIVIAFPLFMLVGWLIARSFAREPEQRGSAVRKWLTYVTLFIASLVLIGDLIFLINTLLSGELPPRVLLKVAVVFLIAGVVFWHYLRELQLEESAAREATRRTGILAPASVVMVAACVIAGLIVIGSPRRARMESLDYQRSNDLQSLVTEVDVYFKYHAALPDSLGQLRDSPERQWVPNLIDAATGEPYGYRIVDSTTYELCATFQRANAGDPQPRVGMRSRFWTHAAGRQCFTLRVTR
jgi:hypothetical protein